ncbi:MAG: glycosyltransferase [Eubacterium sp.]
MKILMVNKFLYPNGGSETYIFKLGEYLKSIGHQVEYFGMEHQGRCVENSAGQYTSDMDFHSGSIFSKITYPVKTVYSKEAKKKMGIVLKDFQPDVVHLNNFNFQLTPSIILAVKEYEKRADKKVKIIYTSHDYQLICPNHMMYNSQDEVCEGCIGGKFINCAKGKCIHSSTAKSAVGAVEAYYWNSKGVYNYIDKIICPSAFMKSKLDTNPIFKDKTVVFHNFVEKVDKADVEKEDYVLYFGRFSHEKGIDTIVNARDINFVLAGSGYLEDYINGFEHIKNIGFKSGKELEMLIRKAKCSVYPSIWYENCPFSVMESIMYGTPVIGADIGGIPELIENGKTGVLFESGSCEAFAQAIKSIINDDQKIKEMQKNCFEAQFDTVEQYTDKYLKLLEEI